MQHAGGKRVASEQCVAERRLADADAAEHGDVQLAAGELVEQAFDLGEILAQLAAHGRGNAGVVEQGAQRFAGLGGVRAGGS